MTIMDELGEVAGILDKAREEDFLEGVVIMVRDTADILRSFATKAQDVEDGVLLFFDPKKARRLNHSLTYRKYATNFAPIIQRKAPENKPEEFLAGESEDDQG